MDSMTDFLTENKTATISLTLEKQIIKKIPKSDYGRKSLIGL